MTDRHASARRELNDPTDILAANRQAWEQLARQKCDLTTPWLSLDVEIMRQYAAGKLDPAPERLMNFYPPNLLSNIAGKDVLCLASGGGQQSAVFGLLGANVTVVDLAEGQLAGDRAAAEHYGYPVKTIRADMRDLGALAAGMFDLVFQAPSMAYVPEVRDVYREVARVLRPGGRYRVQFTNPATEFVDPSDWDGQGYRITRPYAERVRHRDDGGIEFRHFMSDIFNGLVESGLSIEQVEEDPHFRRQIPGAMPGRWDHWLTCIVGFAVVARKWV